MKLTLAIALLLSSPVVAQYDGPPPTEVYNDDVEPLEITEHETIYEIIFWLSERPPLIIYSATDKVSPSMTAYKGYEKIPKGGYRLKDKRKFIINPDSVVYIEIKEMK